MGRKGNRGGNKGKVNINLEQHSKHSSEYDEPVRHGENLSTMDEELKQLEEAKLLSYQSYTQRGIPSYSQPSYTGTLKANLSPAFMMTKTMSTMKMDMTKERSRRNLRRK